MTNDILIKCEHVSKKFCKDLKRSLWYGLKDIGKSLFGGNNNHGVLRKDEFWAVHDVSFELKRGECLGLIGLNGAGKSTLLKMLNGLINPDQGTITMKGRIGALIELGAGFNPILTGRENIYNNGAVLGLTKNEIDEKFDEIVAFSEIKEFIDMPVQNYSSGMKVRLGFAIASQIQPDILIIDEVLAVGDLGFVIRCLNKMSEIIPNTATIFVTHSMPMMARICNEVLLLDKGKAEYKSNDISKGIQLYVNKFEGAKRVDQGDGSVSLKGIKISNNETNNFVSNDSLSLKTYDDLFIEATFDFKVKQLNVHFFVIVLDMQQREVFASTSNVLQDAFPILETGEQSFRIKIPKLTASHGKKSITIGVTEEKTSKILCRTTNSISFFMNTETVSWATNSIPCECYSLEKTEA